MAIAAGFTRIVIVRNGPYLVKGEVPLVRKTQVVSEYGEPLTWKKEDTIETPLGEYALCRCGQSGHRPFCDGTHLQIDFDGTESSDTRMTTVRQVVLQNDPRLVVKKDPTLCMDSGFCEMRKTTLEKCLTDCDDTQARSLAMSMVERCPSGALTYHVGVGEADIEPDLPQEVADTTEITSAGAIAGPLWVAGGIPVERSDAQPFETRNRVTLCNCGHSSNKPLCDGTHRRKAEALARQRPPGTKKPGFSRERAP
ncbi:MAG: CDGSH iron-sulfur domain-containing protein [Anaerolineales bacterium]|jgi:CDGSH-type Zn-finger protein